MKRLLIVLVLGIAVVVGSMSSVAAGSAPLNDHNCLGSDVSGEATTLPPGSVGQFVSAIAPVNGLALEVANCGVIGPP